MAMVASVGSNYEAWKAVWAEGPGSLYCQEMGTWFSQLSLLNFLQLQVTLNPSCWSWHNFIYLPCILLVFAGENPLSHVLPPFPLCEEGWEGWALICPCGYFFSFFFLGENSGMLPPFRSRGRVTGKPVHYLPIVPFTQCSCPFGLEGNLGNSALCAPMASHPPGFSVNPRWVSHTDLAPPRTSCLCRSFARVLGYCLQASGLKAESKKCLSD